MSDNFLRFIPTDPGFVPSSEGSASALQALRAWMPEAHEVTAAVSAEIQFVDQGANFERVFCSACGVELPIGAWLEALERARLAEFRDLGIVMPCCGARSSLNELRLEWPAGFARFVLEAMNPNIPDLSDRQHARLEQILGTRLRKIWAHY